MDQTDRRLLSLVERDGRASFADIAEAASMSKTACWNRLQGLEKAGLVRGYGARLDRERLGLSILAFVSVTIDLGRHDEFEQAVAGVPAVLDCYTTAGEFDYMLRVVAADVAALDGLLRSELGRLPGVRSFSTRICLKKVLEQRPLMAALTGTMS